MSAALTVRASPTRPLPERPQTVYLSEVIDGWWPEVERRCSACGGWLHVAHGDTLAPGEVACLLCGRLVAEVLPVRAAPTAPLAEEPRRRPGRPPKAAREERRAGRVVCVACRYRLARGGRSYCRSCRKPRAGVTA